MMCVEITVVSQRRGGLAPTASLGSRLVRQAATGDVCLTLRYKIAFY